jgi:hypothetical protein
MQVELSQPCEGANYEWKYAGCHGIERAQVSDRTLAENAPGSAHHVVRGQACGFIDDDDAIHEGGNVVIA